MRGRALTSRVRDNSHPIVIVVIEGMMGGGRKTQSEKIDVPNAAESGVCAT